MDGRQRQLAALHANNPNKVIDLTGQRFGRLTVIKRAPSATPKTKWACACDCGKSSTVTSRDLRAGKVVSCGCLQREKTAAANAERIRHGHARQAADKNARATTPTYRSWKAMLERCRNQNAPNYHLYGGRGITVCEQWQGREGFVTFLRDMGERPDGSTLDRFPDPDGHYQPGNVRWATAKEQAANRRENAAWREAQLQALARGRETQRKRARK